MLEPQSLSSDSKPRNLILSSECFTLWGARFWHSMPLRSWQLYPGGEVVYYKGQIRKSNPELYYRILFILILPINSQMKTNGVDINCGQVLWAEWLSTGLYNWALALPIAGSQVLGTVLILPSLPVGERSKAADKTAPGQIHWHPSLFRLMSSYCFAERKKYGLSLGLSSMGDEDSLTRGQPFTAWCPQWRGDPSPKVQRSWPSASSAVDETASWFSDSNSHWMFAIGLLEWQETMVLSSSNPILYL